MPVFNVTNSALSTLTQAQQDNLILMSNTDIRSILSSLTSLSTVQASQTASIALNTAGVTELKSITVIEKSQVLAKTSFTFAANVWTINVFHELNNRFPITAIFDATGDTQFIQFVGKDLMNGTVELTQAQYDSNTFPLNIVLHSRAVDVVTPPSLSSYKKHPGSAMYYRFLDGGLYSSFDGITGVFLYFVGLSDEFYMPTNTPNLFVLNQTVPYRDPIGTTGGPWVRVTMAEFDEARLALGTIRL